MAAAAGTRSGSSDVAASGRRDRRLSHGGGDAAPGVASLPLLLRLVLGLPPAAAGHGRPLAPPPAQAVGRRRAGGPSAAALVPPPPPSTIRVLPSQNIFDVNHFIDSLRDKVRIVKRLPKKLTQNNASSLSLPPVSWSNESYYLNQILPLFNRYKIDTRIANNGLSIELQKLRCRVSYHALRFTEQIETLGSKLVHVLEQKGPFLALHLRYEMDMLAFSGCTHGCTKEETEEFKKLRYAYPWWREKEIVSELKRLKGLCLLTPEETALVLKALGYGNETHIYIASGEIYGSERRLRDLHNMFPLIVRKETLLDSKELELFHHHSSKMAVLDYIVSIACDTFIPNFDGNMAKVVEGHRRYLGYRKTVVLNRKNLVELLDMHQNKTITWEQFAAAVQDMHKVRLGQPAPRTVFADKPREEDYFYSNPTECLEKNAFQRHSEEQRLTDAIS